VIESVFSVVLFFMIYIALIIVGIVCWAELNRGHNDEEPPWRH
jgi:hypothetical protein